MTKFMSDNVTSACPEVMDGLIAANSGDAVSYGDDEWSIKLQKKHIILHLFEPQEYSCDIFLKIYLKL